MSPGVSICLLLVALCPLALGDPGTDTDPIEGRRSTVEARGIDGEGPLYQENFCPKLKDFSGNPIEVGCFKSFMGISQPLHPDKFHPEYQFYRYPKTTSMYRRWQWDQSVEGERDDLLGPDSLLSLIVHGFTDSTDKRWMHDLKKAVFTQANPEKRSVILVDWREGAKGPAYPQAARNVFMLAKVTAELLHRLISKYKLKEENIHLIGHSLGGQTVSQTMKHLYKKYNFRVGRATTMDAASPLFEQPSLIPNKNHTHYLESIHTSVGNNILLGYFGLKQNFGHLDMYPNGGGNQPGCFMKEIPCSHKKAMPFYSQLLTICSRGCPFEGTTCASAETATTKTCNGPKTDICKRMNELKTAATPQTSDIFYFETKDDKLQSKCNLDWVVDPAP